MTEEGIANSSARLLPANTVCLSRTASVGYVVMMGGPMATSQDFVNWVCGHALNPRYLLYIFLAEQSSIRRFAHGSTHQTMYYPEAKALHVCIPERRYQDEVVEVLGALDDKIEANLNVARVERLLGASLLEQARRSGTTCVALEEASASIARGVAPRYSATGTGVLVLNQKCIRDGEVSLDFARWMDHRTSKAERVARHGDVLVNSTGMGTLGRAARWIGESAIDVDSHISIIRPNPEKCHPAVLAWAVIAAQDELESLAEGSTGQTELSRTRLSSLTIDIPKSGIDRLGGTLAAIDGHCWQLGQERRTLAQLRDTLLPKLISGDLRVRDAEAALEAAS